MELINITKNEFNKLLPYQPKTVIKHNEFMITVNVLNSEDEIILVKKIGLFTDVLTFHKRG